MVIAHQERYEYAAEFLGLCHEVTNLGFIISWPPFAQLSVKLKAELDEDAYKAAFERGKSLDLETVVKQLLDEFGE